MIILEDARKFSSTHEKNQMQPKPVYESGRTMSFDPYADNVRSRHAHDSAKDGVDIVSHSPVSNPNIKGIKVKTIPHGANGHGIGVSYSNLVFSYN